MNTSSTTDKTLQFAIYLCQTFPPLADGVTAETLGRDATYKAVVLLQSAHDVAATIQKWWEHWCKHPEFAKVDGEYSEIWNPHVVGVWEHPPGKDGKTESYLLSSLQDITAPRTQKWAGRIFGNFKCIRPYPYDWPVDRYRSMYLSNSPLYGGKAYQCRMALKSLLPKKYHPLLTFVRQEKKRPKTANLREWQLEHAGENWRGHPDLPQWYKESTRDQLNEQRFIEQQRARMAGLDQYIDLHNFWLAATGQVEPEDIPKMIVHQTSFL